MNFKQEVSSVKTNKFSVCPDDMWLKQFIKKPPVLMNDKHVRFDLGRSSSSSPISFSTKSFFFLGILLLTQGLTVLSSEPLFE